jgi:prepilin-type N-terminal cleavage/methylation domain-containing protein
MDEIRQVPNFMKGYSMTREKGITLIELLVVLIISGIIVGGIYRVFIAQSKAYTIQDQTVEVQQTTRSAMELLLRDLRMAGYDNDSLSSLISVPTPIVVGDNTITVSYEFDNTHRHTITYRRDAGTSRAMRGRTITPNVGAATIEAEEIILENVDALNFAYGLDQDENGIMDDRNGNGVIDDGDWVSAATAGTSRVIAVRVTLTARPEPVNEDVQKMVSPRTLVSVVTLRNQCLIR